MQVFRDYRLIECEITMRRLTPIAIREVAVFDTDEVVPVVHAHWIESYWGATGAECSNCHWVIPAYDMDYQEVKHDFEYCPYCGAKMDEEVDDG